MSSTWLTDSIRGRFQIDEYNAIRTVAAKEFTILSEIVMIFPPLNNVNSVAVVVFLVVALYVCLTFLMTLSCVLTREDFVICSEIVHHTIVVYLSSFIQLVFVVRRDDLLEIVQQQMDGVFKYEHAHIEESVVDKIKKDNAKLENKLFVLPLLTLIVGGTAIGIKPILDNVMNVTPNPSLTEKGITFYTFIPLYWPFSMDRYDVFLATNLLFTIFASIVVTGIVAADIIFIKIMGWISLEFCILIESLNAIETRAKRLYETVRVKDDQQADLKNWGEDPVYQDCIEICLKENIKHHHQIMRLHKKFCHVASPPVGAAFFACSIIMGLGMIILNMKNINLGDLMAFCGALAAELLSVFLISWISEGLGQLNEDLFNTVYGIRWFTMRSNIRKMLVIFLNGTRKPLFLKAFGMTTTNMEAFGSVVNSSYSLLNLVKASEARGK